MCWGGRGVGNFAGMENTTNMYNLNESEMLALCKRVMKLEPAPEGCVLTRDDGIDIDAWTMMRARSWYACLLLEAPTEWLPVEDVKEQVALSRTASGAVKAFPPSCCVRAVEWQLEGWSCGVTQFALPSDGVALLQGNPWTQAGACQPVVVDHGNWLMLYSLPSATPVVLAQARCVVAPQSGNFIFHRAALPSLAAALRE